MTRLPFRVLLIALALPITVVAVGAALQVAWLPRLPEQITVHWDLAGNADRTGAAWSMPVLLAVIGVALPAIFTAILARSVRPNGMTATQKLLAVTSLFVGVFLSLVITASVAIQLPPGVEVSIPGTLALAGLLSGGLAVAALTVLPATVPGRSSTVAPSAPVAVAPGERVVWVGRATMTGGILVILLATMVLATAAVAFAVAVSGVWLLLVVPLVLALALLATTSFTVRVDAAGLSVRGSLGWPVQRVPIAEVASAGVISVVPLGEFGGYGMRLGLGGRVGFVTRGGEALEVTRRDGRAVVVTVDDAATAAGLLTAYAS